MKLEGLKAVRPKKPKLGRYSAVAKTLLQEHDEHRVFVEVSDVPSNATRLDTIDLFAGAGGMSLGLEMARFRVVSAVEIVEIAAATHRKNFPNCKVHSGDISSFEPSKDVPTRSVRLVAGGPPCQGFSVAGRRDPTDARNRLFREFIRVVHEVRPDYFVMENVPGILTMSQGRVKDAILEAFADIGYPNTSIAVLEAASFGVAQIRARAIFVGNRHGLENPFPAPCLTEDKYVPIETAIGDLPSWVRLPEINHEWTKHSKKFEERISKVPPGGSLYETFVDAFKRQYKGLPSMTIKENHGGTHIHPSLDRCISAREMARLQSFPDDFLFEGTMKKAMWQIGNAVPPLMAKAIGCALRPFIEVAGTSKSPSFTEWTPPEIASSQSRLF
jgi:DNA (cytosine-5)-methyltransferase 1